MTIISARAVSGKKRFRFLTRGMLCLLAPLCVTGTLFANIGSADMTTVLSNNGGDVHNRVNILFVSAGYSAAQMEQYHTDVAELTKAITNPERGDTFLAAYKNYFNVYRVESAGASEDDATNIVATMDYNNVTGSTTWGRAKEGYLNPLLATAVILKNSTTYGGATRTGNPSQFITMYARDGVNNYTTAREVFLHESGHAIAGLADEYGSGAYGDYTPGKQYTGSIPTAANLTTDSTGSKWARWMVPEKPVVGTGLAVVPTEGGYYYDKGIYRASPTSKMNVLGNPFDAVGREQYILSIYQKIRPLDTFTGYNQVDAKVAADPLVYHTPTSQYDKNPRTGKVEPYLKGTAYEDILFNKAGIRLTDTITLGTGEVMMVTPIDSGKIKIQWYLDGVLTLEGLDEAEFKPQFYGVSIGETHEIQAWCWDQFAYDQDYVRLSLDDANNLMMQKIIWESVVVIPEPSTYAFILAAGALAGLAAVRRRRK